MNNKLSKFTSGLLLSAVSCGAASPGSIEIVSLTAKSESVPILTEFGVDIESQPFSISSGATGPDVFADNSPNNLSKIVFPSHDPLATDVLGPSFVSLPLDDWRAETPMPSDSANVNIGFDKSTHSNHTRLGNTDASMESPLFSLIAEESDVTGLSFACTYGHQLQPTTTFDSLVGPLDDSIGLNVDWLSSEDLLNPVTPVDLWFDSQLDRFATQTSSENVGPPACELRFLERFSESEKGDAGADLTNELAERSKRRWDVGDATDWSWIDQNKLVSDSLLGLPFGPIVTLTIDGLLRSQDVPVPDVWPSGTTYVRLEGVDDGPTLSRDAYPVLRVPGPRSLPLDSNDPTDMPQEASQPSSHALRSESGREVVRNALHREPMWHPLGDNKRVLRK